LDADMRRPTVHTQFKKSNRIGLSDLLTRKMRVARVATTLENVPNLHIISCGTRPPNPTELLGSARMTELIEEFRELYDFVVIDSPPLIVSDAQILSSRVDGILMVIQPGKTRAIAALRPLEELRRIGARVIGVVLNRIPRNKDYYYGGYYYYSPYLSSDEDTQSGGVRSARRRRRTKHVELPEQKSLLDEFESDISMVEDSEE
jgi:succinoglycan biosynthesis transport protein ExoP